MKPIFILLFMVWHASSVAQVAAPTKYADSLFRLYSKSKIDTVRVKLLQDASHAMSEIDPQQGIRYAEMARDIALKLPQKKWLAGSYGVLALNLNARADVKNAVAANHDALKIFEQIGDKVGAAGIHSNLSLIYLGQGKYPEALKNAFDALQIYENSDDPRKMAMVLENIGHVYYEQKNLPKTEQYYNRALEIYQKEKAGPEKSRAIARTTGNLSRVFQDRGEYKEALTLLFSALKSNEDAGRKNSVQINYANIGNVYEKMGEYDKSVSYHKKALAISQEMNNLRSMAVNHGNLGSVLLEAAVRDAGQGKSGQGALNKATGHLETAVELCRQTGFSGPLAEFNQNLINAYVLAGKYKAAFELQKSNVGLKDSIFSLQSKVVMQELETKRAVELKNKDLVIQEKILQINQLKSDKQRFAYLSGMVILATVLCVLVILIIRRSRSHRDQMAHIIHIQSHKVRGPVATLLGLSSLLVREKLDPAEQREMLEGIHATASELDQVITNVIKNKDS